VRTHCCKIQQQVKKLVVIDAVAQPQLGIKVLSEETSKNKLVFGASERTKRQRGLALSVSIKSRPLLMQVGSWIVSYAECVFVTRYQLRIHLPWQKSHSHPRPPALKQVSLKLCPGVARSLPFSQTAIGNLHGVFAFISKYSLKRCIRRPKS